MDKKEKRREYDRRRHEDAKLAYAALMKFYPLSLENLEGEEWKEIAGYNGDYQVSNFGRVKSFKYKTPRILTPVLRSCYLSVSLSIGNKAKQHSIHVLAAEAFIPNPDNKPEVNHDDGNKFNCHVSNLYWATGSENQQHAVRTGLAKTGTEHHQAKIKDEKIIRYIRANPDNLSTKELAEKFNVSETTIRDIQRGEIWQNTGGTIREPKFHMRRVPDEERNQIKADWATGLYTQRELAEKYGVGQPTICRIIREG